MLRLKVCPDTDVRHVSPIYAGLYDLEAQGKIKLKFTYKFPDEIRNSKSYNTLYLSVEDLNNSKFRNICFDMSDSGKIGAVDRLRECDIYFKRSYQRHSLYTFGRNLRKKVYPYGLYYPCRSSHERHILQRYLIYHSINNNLFKHPVRSFKDISVKLIRASLPRSNILSFQLYPPLVRELEVDPKERAEPKILFQTRLWEPTERRKLNPNRLRQMNDMRANTVKALRSEFGNRFIGGVSHTPFAKENYPDCLASEKTDKANYMGLVRKCLIGVTTTGLHNSIGAKLPEYLAASRCIITEPLEYELPVSLKEGKNYLPFKTPEECVEMCKRILDDQEFANEMRYNNYKYY